MNASCVALPVKEARHNSRTGSLVSPIVTRSHRVSERFFELDRVSLARCDSRLGSAIDDASDRLLHSETTETRVPVASSFPGAAVTRARLSATPVDALVPRLAPRAHSYGVAPRAGLPSEDERAGTERLGAARCKQDRRRSRFTARPPLWWPVQCVRTALILPRADRATHR
jgi:hypothetical protein